MWTYLFICEPLQWICVYVLYFLTIYILMKQKLNISVSIKKRVVKCEVHQDVVALWMRMNFALNTLRPRQDGRHFPEHILRCIFLNENISVSINISLKFVPKGRINNNPALVQIMAWRRSGDKPLPEPMVVRILTHICVIRPQWVKMVTYCYLLHLLSSTEMDIWFWQNFHHRLHWKLWQWSAKVSFPLNFHQWLCIDRERCQNDKKKIIKIMSFPFQWYTSHMSIRCMLYCQYLLVTPQITASLCGKTGITQHWSYCCQNWAESGSTDTVLVCLLLHSTCILHLFDFWLSDCDKFLLFELLRWKNRLWSRTVVGRSQTVSQSPCTALKAAVRAVMGTASGLWEMGGNSMIT